MKSLVIYLFALCLMAFAGSGTALQAQRKRVPADSSQVQVRSVPASDMQKYRNDDAFNYNQQQASGMSLWERIWNWIFGAFDKIGNNAFWTALFKVVLWGLCIFAFVYATLKFSGMQGIGIFTGNKKAAELDYSVTEEDIYAIDFTKSIAAAMDQKNHRLAIRLLYLQTLRRLADAELIRWKLNKTNDVYASELTGSIYYKEFAYLTLAYDYAWYGDFSIRDDQFAEVQQHFSDFQQQLPV